MKPEELDKATADEAWRLLEEGQDVAIIAARLAREGWTPTEPVDSDVLAYRGWMAGLLIDRTNREKVLAGEWDRKGGAKAFVAGARMAREQERERTSGLVATLEALKHSIHRSTRIYADAALNLYNAGKAAR